MLVSLPGILAFRLYNVASQQERDFDEVLYEAIEQYLYPYEIKQQSQLEEMLPNILRDNAELIERLKTID